MDVEIQGVKERDGSNTPSRFVISIRKCSIWIAMGSPSSVNIKLAVWELLINTVNVLIK